MYAFRRRLQPWWADGWDLLVTPTLAEPPPRSPSSSPSTTSRGADAPRRSVGALHARLQHERPAGDQPAAALDADGLPIGVQLVAAYGREDVLLRVASQLEAAHPWGDRHPAG